MAQVEALVFAPDELIEPAILLEDIRIVEAGDDEDIADPEFHQVLKPLKPGAIGNF